MKNNACVLIISPLKSIANDQIKEAFNGLIGWLVNRLLNEVVAKTGRGRVRYERDILVCFSKLRQFPIGVFSDWSFCGEYKLTPRDTEGSLSSSF